MENYKNTQPLETRIDLHAQYSINSQGWHTWLQQRFNITAATTILELGCGTGHLWKNVDPGSLDQLRVALTDNSNAMLASVQEQFQKHPGFTYHHLDLNSNFIFPVQPDLLICNHVLYHVEDPVKVLQQIRDQISETTTCLFATNGITSMSELSGFLPDRLSPHPFGQLLSKFTLHTGYGLVRSIFGNATIYRYPDALQIDSVHPLMDYVTSLSWGLSAAEIRTARTLMEEHLEEFGMLYISKDSGVICTKNLC